MNVLWITSLGHTKSKHSLSLYARDSISLIYLNHTMMVPVTTTPPSRNHSRLTTNT
jgi:hypothetical protein